MIILAVGGLTPVSLERPEKEEVRIFKVQDLQDPDLGPVPVHRTGPMETSTTNSPDSIAGTELTGPEKSATPPAASGIKNKNGGLKKRKMNSGVSAPGGAGGGAGAPRMIRNRAPPPINTLTALRGPPLSSAAARQIMWDQYQAE